MANQGRAQEFMRNALFFNLAGSSLGPILAHTLRGMKGIVGLGKESKELTEAAAKRNIQLSKIEIQMI